MGEPQHVQCNMPGQPDTAAGPVLVGIIELASQKSNSAVDNVEKMGEIHAQA
jgi:hypothetical protein